MLLATALEDWKPTRIDYVRVLGSRLTAPQTVGNLTLDTVMPVVYKLALSGHGYSLLSARSRQRPYSSSSSATAF